MSEAPVLVRFVQADAGHREPNSFLRLLVEEAAGRPTQVVDEATVEVDLQFTSVQLSRSDRAKRIGRRMWNQRPTSRDSVDSRWEWSNPPPEGPAQAHVWFTGENVRPPMGNWDGYLSFDTDPLNGKNAYCPLWWWSVGVLGKAYSPFMQPAPSIHDLMSARNPGPRRRGFAVAFINNPDPMRLHAIAALSRVGTVDVFGRAVGRPVSNKAEVARDYKFVLCFENDYYPGYVTEKAIEAWACGAIPIWWGSDPAGYLNPEAMIDVALLGGLREAAQRATDLASSEDAWASVAARPLIMRAPDLAPARDLLRRSLGLR